MDLLHETECVIDIEQLKRHAKSVVIEGHRGGKFEYDNTMAAFHKAVEHGLKSVEFDVWLTQDKVPIVIHGGLAGEIEHACPHLGITETTLINDIPLDHIKQIVLPKGERIPTLEELIDEFHGKVVFNCEVKETNPEFAQILIDLLLDREITEGFVVSSFLDKQLDLIGSLAQEQGLNLTIAYGYEFIDTMQPDEYLRTGDIITFDYKCMTPDLVNRIHRANKKTSCYFYPASDETDETYPKVMAAGIDIVITDRPLQLRKYLNELESANHN